MILLTGHIAASERIPKYLFRMWHAGSGGNPKLNSRERIIPPAFYEKENSGHRVVCAITRQHFVDMVEAHLCGDHFPLSEFSSWSSSLQFVLNFACSHPETAHISVIDTEKLKRTNAIFHTPSLSDPLGIEGFYEEYLAHGVIEGEAHMAVSYKALLSAGLSKNQHHWMLYGQTLGQVVPITRNMIQDFYDIAGAYGPELQLPMTLAMVCMTKRSEDLWQTIPKNEVELILETLGGPKAIPDWSSSIGVMTDVYPEGFGENQQMLSLMKSLHSYCWGRHARSRRRNFLGLGKYLGLSF